MAYYEGQRATWFRIRDLTETGIEQAINGKIINKKTILEDRENLILIEKTDFIVGTEEYFQLEVLPLIPLVLKPPIAPVKIRPSTKIEKSLPKF